MKKVALAAVFATAASTAYAGGYSDPIVEPPVLIEEAASTSKGSLIIPLMLIAIAIAAAG